MSSSVNDGIEPELCSLYYTSVDEAEAQRPVDYLGIGAQMVKFDMESAYHIVPVHPDDRPLLGMPWKGCWNSTSFWLDVGPKDIQCGGRYQ